MKLPGAKKNMKPKTGRERTAAYRSKMRAQGMRMIQLWLPDARSPKYRAAVDRQLRLLAQSAQEKRDQAFVESITEWNDA